MTDKEKQELYENICNDISCGTYILAPQYVDKLLAKLEKENAELRAKESFVGDQNRKLCEQQQKIEVLEKENAELKAENEANENGAKKYAEFYFNTNDQLTKAKDILQRLMENQPTPSSMYEEIDLVGWREVNKEAEQFLKEE